MDKLLLFPGKTDRGVFTYVIDAEHRFLEKTAAEYHPTIAAYIHAAKPIKGKTQLLITALGAGEWWGHNVNGDYFTEAGLAFDGPQYGFRTFETNAKIYKHHVNKDPTASFGTVALAVYNPTYHRVELIVLLDNAGSLDVVKKIEHGEYPDWSMGCLRADAPVLLEDFTSRAVSELQPGDRVVNGLGGISEVDYPHSHHHKGTWYHVTVLGMHSAELEPTTEEHPWLVIPAKETECSGNPNNKSRRINLCLPNRGQKKGCVACPEEARQYAKVWKPAAELELGDYVATPVIQGISEVPEPRMAYLLGLYLAEGHITADGYIELNVNAAEGQLLDKLASYFPDVSIKWTPRTNSTNAARINIYDKALARYVDTHAGRGAGTKRLSATAMRWDVESQKILLGAYCDGDGGVYKDAVYFSTCNRHLAGQVQMVLLRLGCISSMNVNLHKPSTAVFKDTVEYQIWVGRDTAPALKGYSFKTRKLAGPNKMVKNHRFIYDGHLWSPIVAISTEVCDEPVYNVAIRSETYDSDSYVVNGVALHNCRVPYDVCNCCGNKAPTRKQYCECARYYLGRWHPKYNKVVYVLNTFPRFHDISIVFIGADRIAKTLMKVAHTSTPGGVIVPSSALLAEKMAVADKAATIEKEIPADEPPFSQEALKDLADGIREVKSYEPSLPRQTLDQLARAPLPELLSTTALSGMLLKPQEFQRIVLRKMGRPGLADQLDQMGCCFDPGLVDEPTLAQTQAVGMDYRRFDPSIFSLLQPFLADRSYLAPPLGKRLFILIKEGGARQPLPTFINATNAKALEEKLAADNNERERKPIGLLPMMMLAAGLYAAAAKSGPREALSGIDKVVGEHAPLAAALGIGLAAIFNKIVGDKAKGQYAQPGVESPDTNKDVYDRIEEHKQKPMYKVAFPSSPLMNRLIIGPVGAYVGSGMLQKHRELNPNEEEGQLKRFFRLNPDVVSGALIADAMLHLRGKGTHPHLQKVGPALRTMGSKGVDLAKRWASSSSLTKVAAVEDVLTQALVWPLAFARGSSALPGKIVGGLFDQAVLAAGQKLVERNKGPSAPRVPQA
jgi:hypothetical protein